MRFVRLRRLTGRTAQVRLLVASAALVAVLLLFPGLVPNTALRLGSLLETFLPWLGLAVPVLLGAALLRRSRLAAAAVVLPAAAWLGVFAGQLPSGGGRDLVAVQHNVSDVNPDPAGTAAALAAERPDLVALQELLPEAVPAYATVLDPELPHHAVRGTVGLWSRHPLHDVRLLDIRPTGADPGWSRALRATVRLPAGEVAVYVAHLPSLRLGLRHGFDAARRDESAARLAALVAAEPIDRVLLLGDLNATAGDRGIAPLTAQLRPARSGFAFSWPAGSPVARIDQVMARSATVTRIRALPATGSDHLPVAADVTLA